MAFSRSLLLVPVVILLTVMGHGVATTKRSASVASMRARRSGLSKSAFEPSFSPSSKGKRLLQQRGGIAAAGAKGVYQAPPTGTSTMTASIFNLAKNIIGGGMLALPAGLIAGAGTGYLPAFILLVFSALSSAYTFVLVGRSVEVTKASNFKDVWSRTVGPSSAWIVDYAITSLAFGICIVYACFVGDTFSSLFKGLGLPAFISSREASIVAVTATTLFPLTLLKDLSALQYSSYIGIVAVIYTVVFMVWRFVDGTYLPGGQFHKILGKALQPKPHRYPLWLVTAGTSILFNMFSTSYMAHTNAVKFYNELEARSVPRFLTTVGVAMGAATLVYGVVMVVGFETFGRASQGLILNNYHVSADVLATLGRVATAISIIGAHPLLFAGLRDSFLNLLPEAKARSPAAWLGSTIFLLGSATLVSLVCKNVSLLVSLVGSSLGALLVYVFPAYMYLHLLKNNKELKASTSKSEAAILHLTILFGIVSGIAGTAITLLSAFTDVFNKK